MSKRDYLVNYLGKKAVPGAGIGGGNTSGGTAGTGGTVGHHALDGPEHTVASTTDLLLATVDHVGLMAPLSGSVADVWRGNGTWGASGSTAFVEHGAMGSTEGFNPDAGEVHVATLDDDCTATISAPAGDGPITMEWWITGDGDGNVLTIAATGGSILGDTPPVSVDGETFRLLLDRVPDTTNDWVVSNVGGSATAIEIDDEGTPLTTSPTSIDFVGAGVTATAVGDDVTVTIPGTPTGSAGGDLSGTYPNPSVVDDSHSHTAATLPAPAPGANEHAHVMDILFSGDASTTAFTLPAAPVDAYSVQAFVAGVLTEVTLSGADLTTATFGSAPGAASNNVRFDIIAAVL